MDEYEAYRDRTKESPPVLCKKHARLRKKRAITDDPNHCDECQRRAPRRVYPNIF